MGHSVSRIANVSEWVFPNVKRTYEVGHEHLISFPCHEVSSCALYFHPNAVDIGECIEDMEAICDGAYDGDAIIIAPEYPGYGLLNDYEPCVEGIDLVAMTAWQFCFTELSFGADRIMLWGRSIGCGPATRLAWQLGGMSATRAQMNEETHPKKQSYVPVGALVLMAPYVSIPAVVEHHTASPFLGSLVGPMWEVLDYVKDARMQEVALCVLHPKKDDIIPSIHGLKVYQEAMCRRKHGLWLSFAGHNFQPEEDHFAQVKVFLSSVIQAHRLARTEKFDGVDIYEGMLWQTDPQDRDPEAIVSEAMAFLLLEKGSTTSFDRKPNQDQHDDNGTIRI
eukprot:TRINITY_DN20076_c0_g1_i4.p2 TRINITY_DN20076_c0_g1~~TRINITY_DN20076_c0_g1_i4.p2  ORF type:complete len:336 (+),score=51.83 TRINITY_DN20076_c0_g1_i4:200-1207(+)